MFLNSTALFLVFRELLRNRCQLDLRTTAMISEKKKKPDQSPQTISSAEPADHKRNTGGRADARPPSRTQGSVMDAGQRRGCCASLLLRGNRNRPNCVSGLHTVFRVSGALRRQRAPRAHKHSISPSETAAAEGVRTQCLGWERLAALYLLLCSAGLSRTCCCPMPSTEISTSEKHVHLLVVGSLDLILLIRLLILYEYSYSYVRRGC